MKLKKLIEILLKNQDKYEDANTESGDMLILESPYEEWTEHLCIDVDEDTQLVERSIKSNEKELYQKAMATWGIDLQLVVLMEECGELIKECSKIIRARNAMRGTIDYEPFIEELMDTHIMIEQIRYGWLDGLEDTFQSFTAVKLNKVEGWLNQSLDGKAIKC